MTKSTLITARIDPELKQETEKVFDELGLTMTQAITLFFKQVKMRQGLPFAVAIPNAETRQALDDALAGKNLHKTGSVDFSLRRTGRIIRTIIYTSQFKRDFKHVQKQNKDLSRLKTVITKLATGETLEEKFKDHALQGNYAGARDCHISPDWLLIYAIIGDELRLVRTGSHSDLFE